MRELAVFLAITLALPAQLPEDQLRLQVKKRRAGTSSGGGGGNTPAFVQATSCNPGTVTSGSCAFSGNVTSASALLVGVMQGGLGQTLTISADSQSLTWTTLANNVLANDGSTQRMFCAIATSSAAESITVNSTASGNLRIVVWEESGTLCTLDTTTSPSGGTTGQDQTGLCGPTGPTLCTSGNITTTSNNDFLWGFHGGGTATSATVGSGWSNLTCFGACASAMRVAAEGQVGTTAGTYAATLTVGADQEIASTIICLKHS